MWTRSTAYPRYRAGNLRAAAVAAAQPALPPLPLAERAATLVALVSTLSDAQRAPAPPSSEAAAATQAQVAGASLLGAPEELGVRDHEMSDTSDTSDTSDGSEAARRVCEAAALKRAQGKRTPAPASWAAKLRKRVADIGVAESDTAPAKAAEPVSVGTHASSAAAPRSDFWQVMLRQRMAAKGCVASGPACQKESAPCAPLVRGFSKALLAALDAARDSLDLRIAILQSVQLQPPTHPLFQALLHSTVESLSKAAVQTAWAIIPPAGCRADLAAFLRSPETQCSFTDPSSLPNARRMAAEFVGTSRRNASPHDIFMHSSGEWCTQTLGCGANASVLVQKVHSAHEQRCVQREQLVQQLERLQQAAGLAHGGVACAGATAGAAAPAPNGAQAERRRARPADASHDAETAALEPALQAAVVVRADTQRTAQPQESSPAMRAGVAVPARNGAVQQKEPDMGAAGTARDGVEAVPNPPCSSTQVNLCSP